MIGATANATVAALGGVVEGDGGVLERDRPAAGIQAAPLTGATVAGAAGDLVGAAAAAAGAALGGVGGGGGVLERDRPAAGVQAPP